MGALRIKETVDELLDKDPYELFSLDRPHGYGRRLRPAAWGAAGAGVLAAFGVAAATLWQLQRTDTAAGDQPFAYFEIKAIDPDGRPVAGAVVKEHGATLGVTDSFGEWRRFMRVKPGTTVLLALAKRTEAGGLSAVKNIAVPVAMPKSGDLELTGSVQLAPTGGRGRAAARPLAAAPVEAPAAAAAPPARPADAPRLAPPRAGVESELAAAAAAPAAADGRTDGPGGDYANVWFMAEGRPAPATLEGVVTALRRRSRELGVKVEPSSPWRVSVAELTLPGEEGKLVRVDGLRETGGHLVRTVSFLRNYGDNAAQTARDILWSLGAQVAKSYETRKRDGVWYLAGDVPRLWALAPGRLVYGEAGQPYRVAADGPDLLRLEAAPTEPCAATVCTVTTPGIDRAPPVAGWQRLRLAVLGAGADTLVYVSGHAAHALSDKLYEYWGAPGSGANVTAVRGGRLVFRGRIQTTGAGQPSVTLPSAPLSLPYPAIDKSPPAARQW